jgi:hypothetical protein
VIELVAAAPAFLCAAHGDVGVAHQTVCRAIVEREQRNADARIHVDLLRGDLKWGGECFEGLGCDACCVIGAAHVREDHRELVAAQARDRIAAANAFAQALRNRVEQRIADLVAERLVDRLEAMQVDMRHANQATMPLRFDQRLAQTVGKQHAIGQSGKHVIVREIAQAGFGILALNDTAELSCHRVQRMRDGFALELSTAHEHLEHCHHLRCGDYRNSDRADKTIVPQCGRDRPALIVLESVEPYRLFHLPHAPGQPGAGSELQRLAHAPQPLHFRADPVPGGAAFEAIAARGRQPCLSCLAAGGLAHAAQRRGQCRVHVGCFRHRHRQFVHEAQVLLSTPAIPPLARFAQLPIDGREQAFEIALDDVVVRAGLHRLHRRILADGSGHEDERHIAVALFDHFQSAASAEARHREVDQHEIPRLVGERLLESLGGVYAMMGRFVAAALELMQEQCRVIDGILDHEHMQRSCHIPHLEQCSLVHKQQARSDVRPASSARRCFLRRCSTAVFSAPTNGRRRGGEAETASDKCIPIAANARRGHGRDRSTDYGRVLGLR